MNQDDILIRGPALRSACQNPRPRRTSRSRRNHASPSSTSASNNQPTALSSLVATPRAATAAHHEAKVEEEDHETSPSNTQVQEQLSQESQISHSSLTYPMPPVAFTSSTTMPNTGTPNWHTLNEELNTTLPGGRLIPDLRIMHVRRDVSEESRIRACPFILAHLTPPERIIPLHPLSLRSNSDYLFHLLYVLKESVTSPSGNYTVWTTVFLMTTLGSQNFVPVIIGSHTTEDIVNVIRNNIERERRLLRNEIEELFHRALRGSPNLHD